VSKSPFAIRGVIEGFYGPPWSHAQRLDMIDFLARHKMNTFLHAPKDDPFIRENWRDPYTGEQLEVLKELIDRSAQNSIMFVPCLSPGLSMEYSSTSDRSALIEKFLSTARLGVSAVGLLLDDIPLRLQHPDDQAVYDSLVSAQIAAINAVYEALPTGMKLFVCPTQYYGRGDEDYLTELGRGIDPRIEVFWTGREICSPALDLYDAAVITRTLNRPVTFWDNYPVNDVAMTHELHVGPYQNRDRDLARFSRGVIANPMEYFESSKIALATIADYLNDPQAYEPEASWSVAIEQIAGPAAEDYRIFADNSRSSCLSPTDAPELTAAFDDFFFARDYGDPQIAAEELSAFADDLLGAAQRLKAAAAAGNPLLVEAAAWLETFDLGARTIKVISELSAAPTIEELENLKTLHAQIQNTGKRMFGDVLHMTLMDLTMPVRATPNLAVRMDRTTKEEE